MKNKLYLIAVLLLFNHVVNAQKKITQGKLVMEMSLADSSQKNEAAEFLPEGMVIYFKDSLSRTEFRTKMGTMVMYYDARKQESTTCMEMMDKKIAMKQTLSDVNTLKSMAGADVPIVKLTEETKTIAGLKCKKAVITYKIKGKDAVVDTWYTKDLSIITMDNGVQGVDGYALETISTKDGIGMKLKCKSFEKIDVADSLFVVPAGYEEMNMMEMMKGEH